MCGIFAYNWIDSNAEHVAMNYLHQRGPDYCHVINDSGCATIGHLRLKIIDLSDSSSQPFSNQKNTIHVAVNGVIYNYNQLRHMLIAKGHTFISHGDCEVVLHLYEEFGISGFEYLDGQYSIIIWDSTNNSFILHRDPQGIIPLYYSCLGNRFVSSSDLRVVSQIIHAKKINMKAIEYIRCYGYNIDNESVYSDVYLLNPGSILTYKNGAVTEDVRCSLEKSELSNQNSGEELKEWLRFLIESAVKKSLISDVPIGIIISGGLDSSILLECVAKNGGNVKAFTIGSQDKNEFEYSNYMARLCDIPIETIMIDDFNVFGILGEALRKGVLPQDGGSVVPKWILAKVMKERGIKVVIGGTGADECWGGYTRHADRWCLLAGHPESMSLERMYYERNVVRQNIEFVSYDLWNRFLTTRPQYDPIMFYDYFHEVVKYHTLRVDSIFAAHGIEYRIPFLDKDVVKCALTTRFNDKCSLGIRKNLLKEAFKNILPDRIVRREKTPLRIADAEVDRCAWNDKCIALWMNSQPVEEMNVI